MARHPEGWTGQGSAVIAYWADTPDPTCSALADATHVRFRIGADQARSTRVGAHFNPLHR